MFSNCGTGKDSWESLGLQEIKLVIPKGNEPRLFIGRTDAEAEAPVLWPPEEKSQLIGKDPNAGKDWEQEEKGMTEEEMVGWHHWLNRHEFEQTLEDRWRTGKTDMLQSMGSQRIRHDLKTEQPQMALVEFIPWEQGYKKTKGLGPLCEEPNRRVIALVEQTVISRSVVQRACGSSCSGDSGAC